MVFLVLSVVNIALVDFLKLLINIGEAVNIGPSVVGMTSNDHVVQLFARSM